jgi:DNA-binding transcriptional ArsR family regulator
MKNKEPNKDLISEYAGEIPKEVKSIIKALDDDVRLATIVALMKNTKMSFSELKNLFNLNSSSLSYHLTLLQNGGLVINFLELKGESHSYYSVTDLSKSILESLIDIVGNLSRSLTPQPTADVDLSGITNLSVYALAQPKEEPIPQTISMFGSKGSRQLLMTTKSTTEYALTKP